MAPRFPWRRQLDWNPEIAIPFLDLVALLFRTTHVMSTLTESSVAVGLWGAASDVVSKGSGAELTYQRYVDACPAHVVHGCLTSFLSSCSGGL